jgi:branched-chain amino acid transport system permease protein
LKGGNMQIFLNGMISGLFIALLALSFNIVYLPTKIFHIALAGLFSAAPYIAWVLLQNGFPWSIALFASLFTILLLSLGCEVINHAPLTRRRASLGVHLVSSIGLFIIIVQIVVLIWGNETKVLREGVDTVINLANITLTYAQVLTFFITIIMIAIFFLWLKFTNLGLQFRALADNPVEFALQGYNVIQLRMVAFGISGVLCASASLLNSYDTGFDPYNGLVCFLLAVVATIIGGRQSLVGPVVGGILLGLTRTSAAWFFSSRWQEAVAFFFLALFLFAMPNGIFGRKVRVEEES